MFKHCSVGIRGQETIAYIIKPPRQDGAMLAILSSRRSLNILLWHFSRHFCSEKLQLNTLLLYFYRYLTLLEYLFFWQVITFTSYILTQMSVFSTAQQTSANITQTFYGVCHTLCLLSKCTAVVFPRMRDKVTQRRGKI